jgi:hypothetical protein
MSSIEERERERERKAKDIKIIRVCVDRPRVKRVAIEEYLMNKLPTFYISKMIKLNI